jgi:hypothetical protein
MSAFGLPLRRPHRLYMFFFIGLSVFGVFGSFGLLPARAVPDAPARHRRGILLQRRPPCSPRWDRSWSGASQPRRRGTRDELRVLFCVGFVPLAGLLLLPFAIETRGRVLAD